jgi:ABC-type branched-subunit amino acid transport system substrate-binding protein
MTESYQAADISMKTQITKIKGSGAEAIIFVPVSDKASDIVLKEMRDLGISIPVVGEVNLCGFTAQPSNFGLHGFCLNQKIDTEGARTFEADYLKTYGIASQYPVNDSVSYDSVQITDNLIGQGIQTISGLKKALLKGVQGNIMDYEFEPNGEVLDRGYFVKETY